MTTFVDLHTNAFDEEEGTHTYMWLTLSFCVDYQTLDSGWFDSSRR